MQMDTHSRKISLTEGLRKSKWFSGITAVVTTFFFLSTFYLVPCAHAVDGAIEAEKARNQYHPKGRTDEEKLANTLQDIKEHVAERKAQVQKRVETESGLWQDFLNLLGLSGLAAEDLDRLKSMSDQAEQLHQKALEGFDKIEQDLIDKGLPEEILQRHYDAVDKYQDEYDRFLEKLQDAQAARSLQNQNSALGDLEEFLGSQQFKRSQQSFDPNKLPFGTPDPNKTRKPVTDLQELNQLLGLSTKPSIIDKITGKVIPSAYAAPMEGPTAADLEETIDVQITDAIKDLANQLNNDPVEIYNWVRNNIEFIPTYGSIQGSDMTLQSKRGNPFDTASLLIALLRASNIPAKYAYGTVRIPVEKVMNWVGGVEVPEAAQKLLGQGGIPNVAIVNGGQITHIQMEHIWVEAWVDFIPSRGAKNLQPDSWVPLDASFKQYTFSDELDYKTNVQFDFDAYAQTIQENSVIDAQLGSVSGLPEDQIMEEIQPFFDQINQMAADNNITEISEFVGGKAIVQVNMSLFSAGLPYELVVQDLHFSNLPDNFRYKFRYDLISSGTAVLSVVKNTAEVAGKELALSFAAATQADTDLVERIFENSNGQPSSFPGYLVNVKAEFTMDGDILADAGSFRMGTELSSRAGYWVPGRGWDLSQNTLLAGEYYSIGLDLQGISRSQVDKFVDTMAEVKANLESDDQSLLTRHSTIGKILHSNLLGYYSVNDDVDGMYSNTAGVVCYRAPSFGFFFTQIRPEYFFGVPRNLSFPGLTMDIDSLSSIVVDKKNNDNNFVNFNYASGLRASYFENAVPEHLLSTATKPVQGVSATKALSLANAAGQKLYVINKTNAALALPELSLGSDTMREINSAIAAGKIVYTHQANITHGNWHGAGYIILDETTGAGAYRINGGFNGGANNFGWSDFVRMALGVISKCWTVFDAIVSMLSAYMDCEYSSGPRLAVFVALALATIVTVAFGLWLIIAVFTSIIITTFISILMSLAVYSYMRTASDICKET